MSGKAGGIGGIILGAIIAVVAIYTGNYYLLFTAALMIAGGAMNLANKPESNSLDSARNTEMKIATTAVGCPVPVVFGECRLSPNYMHYDHKTYHITELTEEVEGGKGMGGGGDTEQTVGWKYSLRWEAGLCMGPVDQIGQIYSMPGEVEMLPADSWTIFAGDYVDASLKGTDNQEGSIRIYRGSSNQTRVSSGDKYFSNGMNYRNVCWILFGLNGPFDYGRSPGVPTYQVVVRRIPRCLRDDDSTVDEILTRGSDTESDKEYWQANPAAIIYEILTNKVWGRGLSSDIIDEDSFATCSEFFQLKKIGMSFPLEQAEAITDVLEGIRRHLKTILTWDGEKYKLRCLMDVQQTHAYIQTLKSDEISDLQINRPMWEGVYNEIRAEYQSQTRSYRPDIVHVQDIAAKDSMDGRINPVRIQFSSFSLFNLSLQQAQRILSEMSYPYMTASWEMNRYKSHLEVGDIVRIVWDEFNDNVVTTYWLVLTIEDGASDDENIKVTAIEDQLLCPVDGEELSIAQVPGYYPWERWNGIDEGDVTLTEDPQPINEPLVNPHVFELPAILTRGEMARTVITGQNPDDACLAVEYVLSTDGLNFSFIGTYPSFSKTGTLKTELPDQDFWDRSEDGFLIDIEDIDDMADFLAVNAVQTGNDHLEVVVDDLINFVVVKDEIMQVGYFEAVDSDTVRMRNITRGMFGTPIRRHAVDSKIYFFQKRRDGVVTTNVPRNKDYYWRGHPISRFGTYTGTPTSIHLLPDGIYRGLGQCPLAPEPYDLTDGGTMTIKVRPMSFLSGPGVQRFFETMPNPNTDLEGMTFLVQQLDASMGEVDPPTIWPFTWTEPTLDDAARGVVSITATKLATTKRIRVYASKGGLRSARYAEFTVS